MIVSRSCAGFVKTLELKYLDHSLEIKMLLGSGKSPNLFILKTPTLTP